MGFGIAIALALDATLVRLLLIPAAMRLLGERNWYLPRWLAWLPNLQVEGTHQPQAPRRPTRRGSRPTSSRPADSAHPAEHWTVGPSTLDVGRESCARVPCRE